jgi:hypothetical protein
MKCASCVTTGKRLIQSAYDVVVPIVKKLWYSCRNVTTVLCFIYVRNNLDSTYSADSESEVEANRNTMAHAQDVGRKLAEVKV